MGTPPSGRLAGGSPSRAPRRAAVGAPEAALGLDRLYIHAYALTMRFTWDRRKSDANYRERRFDFEFASLIFRGPIVMVEDTRQDYGERRFVAIGLADGLHLTVVFTDRAGLSGDTIRRIISARRSNRRERRLYDQTLAEN